MKARKIVKDIMAQKEIPNVEMAKMLNISPAALGERINNKNVKDIPVSLLQEMLDVLDYKVAIVPTDTELPPDSYTVDTSQNSPKTKKAPPSKGPTPKQPDLDLDKLLSLDEPKEPTPSPEKPARKRIPLTDAKPAPQTENPSDEGVEK